MKKKTFGNRTTYPPELLHSDKQETKSMLKLNIYIISHQRTKFGY
jgi:hypothetical protein